MPFTSVHSLFEASLIHQFIVKYSSVSAVMASYHRIQTCHQHHSVLLYFAPLTLLLHLSDNRANCHLQSPITLRTIGVHQFGCSINTSTEPFLPKFERNQSCQPKLWSIRALYSSWWKQNSSYCNSGSSKPVQKYKDALDNFKGTVMSSFIKLEIQEIITEHTLTGCL
jgi:hypothetical protein